VGYGIQTPPRYHNEFKLAFEQNAPILRKKKWLFLSRIHEKKKALIY
jgi:hypothetical protein